MLAVNEIFGPTLQGEGASVGMPCHFLRLSGCNLACSWCDTPDPKLEVHPRPVDEVVEELRVRGVVSGVRSLVVSGGEPMLQQLALSRVVQALTAQKWHIEVETAGTFAPTPYMLVVAQWNVSPKLAHSGNPEHKRVAPAALDALARTGRATWKFVVQRIADFEEIDSLVAVHQLRRFEQRVYIMPEGQTREQIGEHFTEDLVEEAAKRGYWVTPRLHIAVWGQRKGVR